MAIYESINNTDDGRRVLKLTSPVTLQPLGEIVCANEADVSAAYARAESDQLAWGAKSVKQRVEAVQKLLPVLLNNSEAIVDTVVSETGKARTDALLMEIYAACDSVSYYCRRAEKFLRPEKPRAHGFLGLSKTIELHFKPLGVVGIITPWNGPFILAINPTVQAILAGNAVLLKPSEVTPESGRWLEKVCKEAGLPDGLVQVLIGDGQTGAALVESAVKKIAFTGSVATGQRIAESCGRQLKPCTMELGGKDAMIVCADADIDGAVTGAIIGSCMNSGHYCCGTERIYVVEAVYDRFLEKAIEGVQALRQGSEYGFDEDVGAVFWDKQMAIIEGQVDEAVANGAKVHVGGKRNPNLNGLYYLPTVMTDLNHEMAIMRDENFGPIVCVVKVKDEAEAIAMANDSQYGLHGNVWTQDKQKGIDIARQIDTGGVSVNDMAVGYGVHAAPFGGRKDSGVGQVNGKVGLRGYSFCQPVISDRAAGKKATGFPRSTEQAETFKKVMKFIWTTRIGRLFW